MAIAEQKRWGNDAENPKNRIPRHNFENSVLIARQVRILAGQAGFRHQRSGCELGAHEQVLSLPAPWSTLLLLLSMPQEWLPIYMSTAQSPQ